MKNSFDILMKKAFNEDINVTRSHADSYFKTISKHFNGDGSYKINGKHNVTINTKDFGEIQLNFTEGKDMKSLKVDSVTVNGNTERVSKEINSIKDVPNLLQDLDILFGGRVKVKGSKSSSSSTRERKYKPTTKEELKKLCEDLSVNLGDIDTSLITNMSHLFSYSKRTNEQFKGIETWDVSNVEEMNCMFCGNSQFNQPLNNWDVSNVKSMWGIFSSAYSFNQPLDKWNVSNVRNMQLMFSSAHSFNQPLDKWNVSSVTYMDNMFSWAVSFNQPLNKWDVSNVTDMAEMFKGAKSFNQNLSSWDVSKVQERYKIFDECPIKEEYKPKMFQKKSNESYKGVIMNFNESTKNIRVKSLEEARAILKSNPYFYVYDENDYGKDFTIFIHLKDNASTKGLKVHHNHMFFEFKNNKLEKVGTLKGHLKRAEYIDIDRTPGSDLKTWFKNFMASNINNSVKESFTVFGKILERAGMINEDINLNSEHLTRYLELMRRYFGGETVRLLAGTNGQSIWRYIVINGVKNKPFSSIVFRLENGKIVAGAIFYKDIDNAGRLDPHHFIYLKKETSIKDINNSTLKRIYKEVFHID